MCLTKICKELNEILVARTRNLVAPVIFVARATRQLWLLNPVNTMLYEKNHLLYHIFTKTHLCVRGVKFGPDDSRWHGSSLQRKLNICTRYIPPAWIYSRTNRCTPQVGSGLYEQGDNCVNHFIVRNYTKYQCDLIQAFYCACIFNSQLIARMSR